MNIFSKIALENMKKSRTRTAVTIVGVVLSAAMVTAVASLGVSLINYMTNGAARKYGGWHAAFLDVDSSFIQEQENNSEIADTAVYENIGYAALDGSSSPDKPYLFIAGYRDETFDVLPVTLLSGRMPENSGEILVSGRVPSKDGAPIETGDRLSLFVGKRMNGDRLLGQNDPYSPEHETFAAQDERTYTVVGICRTPAFENSSVPGYTLITKADPQKPADDFSLFVTLKNPRRVHAYAVSAGERTGHGYLLNNYVLRFMGLSDSTSDKGFLTLLYSVAVIVTAIIMTGSIFLIHNSFNISLNERTQQFGILASVGATPKQLRNSVLFEGLCIGAIGIPIGVVLGIGSIRLVISVVAGKFADILYEGVPLAMVISVPAIAGAAAVSMAAILISAYIPARKAVRTPVMECIRQTNDIKVEAKAVKTSKLALHLYGLEGILALKNFKRNKKRYRSIVLSLVLSIVLFVSTSAFVSFFKQMAEQARSVTSYDIGFGSKNMEDGELLKLYDRLKTAEGVYESSYQVVMEYFCAVRSEELSDAYRKSAETDLTGEMVNIPVEIQFLDGRTYLEIIDDLGLPAEEYTGQNGKVIAVAKMSDSSGQAEDVAGLGDVFTSSSVHAVLIPQIDGRMGAEGVPGTEGTLSANVAPETENMLDCQITCVDTVPPDIPPVSGAVRNQPYFFQIMAPYSLMEQFVFSGSPADIRVKGLTFRSENPSRSAEEMKMIIKSSGVKSGYIFLNTSEVFSESRNYIFIANVFAYTFIIMISLIAAANVFNTISTNIKLRRRELAMLRSVGMPDRDFNRMMCFECAFYGMRALLFGLPMAAASSWLIYRGMVAGGAEEIRFVMPWASIGISVFSVLLVIFATMMYAVSKIKKENIIDALRDDMT